MDKEDKNNGSKTENETASDNEKSSIGGSGFSVPSPHHNWKGGIDSVMGGGLLIDSQSSSGAVNEDGNNNSTPGIRGLNKNNSKILIEEKAEDECVGSQRK
jgi:hypothetical protein